MAMECPELACTVAVEKLNPSGEVTKRTVCRNGNLILGRNEFKDIILRVITGKTSASFPMQDVAIHRRFAQDGKACIRLPRQSLQIMISNSPPHQLLTFLKSLAVKMACRKSDKVISERVRLLSEKAQTFSEISPLNQKDVDTLNNQRAKLLEAKGTSTTPGAIKGRTRKRPRKVDEDTKADQENLAPRKKLNLTQLKKEPPLTNEQKKVLSAVLAGQSVFFTGSAGTGKSFLLRHIIGVLPPDSTFATASTGVAACHIGGTTLHQFAGMGSGAGTLQQCIELASRPTRRQQWRKCKHLIVDEISMVDGNFFTKLEAVARAIKRNDQPFGGIQLILCGDFLQLPPVVKKDEKQNFCFMSPAWHRCVQVNCELMEVKRQKDQTFIDILQKIRVGRCPQEVSDRLIATAKHCVDREGIHATRLCTHKEDVDQLNNVHLNKLQGDVRVYEAMDSDPALVKQLNNQCPVRQRIDLKIGAQVMLAKNLDVQRGLVNGARGVVTGFEAGMQGNPKVRFMSGLEVVIRPERWSVCVGPSIILTRRQLPLKLAWAISIHKSQGMSLDCVEISLSRVFECGQAYVALSRATSLQGLRVLDFDASCVRAHPDVIKFYIHLRREQRQIKQMSISHYRDPDRGNAVHWD
ncbi:ATP-dependent DNA helicase PIF1-like [Diadema setosum]|uniref:ATP-dependent DNA helicase PIF1-like n=1 Tax=Diadema setosum TaxID=31175 RepID=UPI003B3AA778